MKIAIGCDHAGLSLMGSVREFLGAEGHEVVDLGTQTPESVDYPDFAHLVSKCIVDSGAEMGVLVCGTGIGMSMAANRHKGIRAAVCADAYTARMARMHNDANVLCLGARVLGVGSALDVLETFLRTEFEGGRHLRRLDKIDDGA